ncbi:hypothetical protein FH972_024381 [Carpinus fangiana]|uniref:SGS domain-containing protein n=1 Tax=Carpinus fangiana TaxID=176857 RepID=A0A5N6KYL7_9ROSI|nr:hypothetical protein FH972_024381 [Carpinus fangiana]
MDSAQRGEVALKEGNPTAAIEYYTKALSSTPTSPVYYVKRSIAYHRTRDYESALVDAECSILAALKRGKRELIAEAQLRRAVTLAAMDRIQDAHICYELAHKYGYKGKDLEIHEAKLKTKRKGLDMQDPKMQRNVSDIPDRELPGAETAPTKAEASEEIRAGDATSKIFGTKIEITLPKATPGTKWGGLEGTASTMAPASAEQTAAPAPTQPSSGPANPYSTRGDFFFKKLFKGATPDQQRAMMKSYQESGGTSLSTNWDEVSKERVKVQPPEGMVEKKY